MRPISDASDGLVYLIGFIIFGSFFGFIATKMAENKGRSKGLWFFLAFIGSILAIIVLAFLPTVT